ncbi:MAG: DUF1800 domain-containing protein [Acidobacteria bacterium]|nr:MAG: DUF1800 domain-containing protein [Acidobacteriota bacterium]PYY21358.1 MAG: DUF1800 domain-containing protein [Acidobacteriota bacterium]
MDEQKRAVHVLNRFTFGPRPGDVQRVDAIGIDKWFEQQLYPEKINDSALEARLAPFRTLRMKTDELVRDFPPPQVIKAVENGRASIPRDPQEKAIYQAAMDRQRQKQEAKQEAAESQNNPDANANDPGKPRRNGRELEDGMYASLSADSLLSEPPDQRFKDLMKMPPDDMRAVARSLNQQERDRMMDGLTPQQKETLQALVNPQSVVQGELTQAKLLRAIYSERQLDEVMTDFWMNHFNVFINKGPDRYMLTSYERDVIRPHVLGKFKDLLVATAKSPAMLFYLDNWQSIGPNSDQARFGGQRPGKGRLRRGPFGMIVYQPPRPRREQTPQQKTKRPSGLNENYAREIMELHTLGVDGGYTQKDVTELAKILTGWTIEKPQQGGEFKFDERRHEPGKKKVLGKEFKEGAEGEAMKALDMLAHHPATAKFISKKLAMRFVSDDPPESLVQRMAKTFHDKDGDIREVLRTMYNSPEFWAPESYRAKVKTPLEFVVSAVRASGADVANPQPLVNQLQKLGMPLYGMQPPTGYPMKAEAWVNSAALLNRMNFSLALASGKLPGIQWNPAASVDQNQLPSDPAGALANFETAFLEGDVSKQTHATILNQLNDPQAAMRNNIPGAQGTNFRLIGGLLLGSPEFQRR